MCRGLVYYPVCLFFLPPDPLLLLQGLQKWLPPPLFGLFVLSRICPNYSSLVTQTVKNLPSMQEILV